MDRQEKASLAALAVAALVVAVTIVLPLVSFPQTERQQGPEVPYGNSSYSISGYYIPTVPQGTSITVEISGYAPGTVILSLFPTSQNTIAPSGPPVASFQRPTGPNASATFLSPSTQPYGIYVVSYNGTSYAITISAIWSPFYVVRLYTYPAAFALIVFAIIAYYFHETAGRRRSEREAMKYITGREH